MGGWLIASIEIDAAQVNIYRYQDVSINVASISQT